MSTNTDMSRGFSSLPVRENQQELSVFGCKGQSQIILRETVCVCVCEVFKRMAFFLPELFLIISSSGPHLCAHHLLLSVSLRLYLPMSLSGLHFSITKSRQLKPWLF